MKKYSERGSVESTDVPACPDCGGKLYEDEADEGPKWYECEKCDFSCDSDYDRETGNLPRFQSERLALAPLTITTKNP